VIGYRDASGEILLAADTRVTWLHAQAGPDDTLQKVSVVACNIAMAACGDVKHCAKLASDVAHRHGLWRARATRDGRSAVRFGLGVRKTLSGSALPVGSEVLVAIGVPGRPHGGDLLHVTHANKKPKVEAVEPGKPLVLGSCQSEPCFSEFEKSVVCKAPHCSGLSLLQRSALLASCYADFVRDLKEPWTTVGEMLMVAFTDNGIWRFADQRNVRVARAGVEVDVSLCHDGTRWRQRNEATGCEVELVPLEAWSGTPSQDGTPFTIGANPS